MRRKPDEAIASAKDVFFTRGYGDGKGMIAAEAKLPQDPRIDYITIVTPNNDADSAAGPPEG